MVLMMVLIMLLQIDQSIDITLISAFTHKCMALYCGQTLKIAKVMCIIYGSILTLV